MTFNWQESLNRKNTIWGSAIKGTDYIIFFKVITMYFYLRVIIKNWLIIIISNYWKHVTIIVYFYLRVIFKNLLIIIISNYWNKCDYYLLVKHLLLYKSAWELSRKNCYSHDVML